MYKLFKFSTIHCRVQLSFLVTFPLYIKFIYIFSVISLFYIKHDVATFFDLIPNLSSILDKRNIFVLISH